MLFRRKSQEAVGTTGLLQPPSGDADVRSCPSLAKALKRISTLKKPRILDLGPLCGSTAVFLANYGARVCVEEFKPPPPLPKEDKNGDREVPEVKPFKIEQRAAGFDLILAWEAIDFTPPDRLEEVTAELKRLVRKNGLVFLLSRNTTGHARKTLQEAPARFRATTEDSLTREASGAEPRTRWVHPTREIERVLKPLSVLGIHLQRDQTREILALRKPDK